MSEETKKAEMAKILSNIDAVEFGLFKLSSGKVTPYYVDLRIVPSFPDAYRDICEFYVEAITKQIGSKSFDRIARHTHCRHTFCFTGRISVKKPFLYVRKGAKLHGRERRVEGILVSGDHVLLVDDLVTTGLTLKEAAGAVRAEGGVVTDAIAFLDREEGGKELLEKSGVKLHALLKMSEMAKILYDMGSIDEESLKTITKQIKKK